MAANLTISEFFLQTQDGAPVYPANVVTRGDTTDIVTTNHSTRVIVVTADADARMSMDGDPAESSDLPILADAENLFVLSGGGVELNFADGPSTSAQYDTFGQTAALGTTDKFLPISGWGVTPSASDDQYVAVNGAKRLVAFQVDLATVPGSGNSRTLVVWVNGAITDLTLTYTAAQSGIKHIATPVDLADGDLVSIKSVTVSGPDDSVANWTLTMQNLTSF